MAYCLRPRRHLTILAPLFVTSLVLLSLSGTAAQTETWIRQFGTPFSDEANDAVIDGSGNLYVGGHILMARRWSNLGYNGHKSTNEPTRCFPCWNRADGR